MRSGRQDSRAAYVGIPPSCSPPANRQLRPGLTVKTKLSLAPLLKAAARPYLKAGLISYLRAYSKLRHDPVYRSILELGLLGGRSHILDLGCGQALLASWLRAAAHVHKQGQWPAGWAAPPRPSAVRGIEQNERDAVRAHRALGSEAGVALGDITRVDLGKADAIVLFDVLHYLAPAAQLDVLRRARAALPPTGLLLLRVGDAEAGKRFRHTQRMDKLVMLARGHRPAVPHYRGLEEWHSVLHDCGFVTEAQPMSEGTPFANVLFVAHAAPLADSFVDGAQSPVKTRETVVLGG
jgi:SAM-dependent methyltransferase